jgi:FAD/FMN-containing dehydrogenase
VRIEARRPSPPTEKLEAPHPALARLVDASTGVPFHKRAWAQLSEPERGALATLGYRAATWDAVRKGDLLKLPRAATRPFGTLSAAEQGAARSLGFTERTWDAERATRADILGNKDILRAFVDLLSKKDVITEAAVREKLIPAARDWGVETQDEKRALLYLLDFHGQRFSMSARQELRNDIIRNTRLDQAAGRFSNLGWNATIVPQRTEDAFAAEAAGAMQVVNDASGLSATAVRDVVRVRAPEDVRAAIRDAKALGLKVSIAGRRHSEGGQSVSAGSLNLDMLGLDRMQLQPDGKTLRVEAGATWAQVQEALRREGRAVKVMQTSNVFTVGGSLSVNCHGRTPGEPPFASTVKSFRIMTADGDVKTCSRTENPELFRNAIGGYGLFGVILDVDLETTEDVPCRMDVELVKAGEYPARLEAALREPGVEMAYGRLSPGGDEALIHVVRRLKPGEKAPAKSADFEGAKLNAIADLAFEASKLGPEALEVRWWAEKKARGEPVTGSRNEFMSPNVEYLRQAWFNEGKKTDILHEYFIPRERFQEFAQGLKEIERRHEIPTLNCTLRDVARDEDTALPYAKKDATAFVLYFNQDISAEGEKKQAALQRDLIDLAQRCGGTFYLPYQLHYTPEQLRKSYPEVDRFFAAKRAADPAELFSNTWYERYGSR